MLLVEIAYLFNQLRIPFFLIGDKIRCYAVNPLIQVPVMGTSAFSSFFTESAIQFISHQFKPLVSRCFGVGLIGFVMTEAGRNKRTDFLLCFVCRYRKDNIGLPFYCLQYPD